MDRRAMGALATAALIAVVSVPLALTTLRDNEPPSVTASDEAPTQPSATEDRTDPAIENPVAKAPMAEPPSEASTSQPPTPAPAPVDATASVAKDLKSVQSIPAPSIAMTAPPPSAPPPPPPPAPAAEFAEESTADSVVVTGSRIARPNLAKEGPVGALAERQAASPLAVIDTYGAFLSQLQAGLRSNDRDAVTALIALPLRVNLNGQTRTYRSAREVERDFDRIFTARVKQSVLNQRPETLRSRGSMMKGSSTIWFGQSSSNGPIRIREVTP